jgi:hypothetical protein
MVKISVKNKNNKYLKTPEAVMSFLRRGSLISCDRVSENLGGTHHTNPATPGREDSALHSTVRIREARCRWEDQTNKRGRSFDRGRGRTRRLGKAACVGLLGLGGRLAA